MEKGMKVKVVLVPGRADAPTVPEALTTVILDNVSRINVDSSTRVLSVFRQHANGSDRVILYVQPAFWQYYQILEKEDAPAVA